jgi:hypothetical protein
LEANLSVMNVNRGALEAAFSVTPLGAFKVIGALEAIVAPAFDVNDDPVVIESCDMPVKFTGPFAVIAPVLELPMFIGPVVLTRLNSAPVSATPPAASAPRKNGVPAVFCRNVTVPAPAFSVPSNCMPFEVTVAPEDVTDAPDWMITVVGEESVTVN